MDKPTFKQRNKCLNTERCIVNHCNSKADVNLKIQFHRVPEPNKQFIVRTNTFGIEEKIDRSKAWQIALKLDRVTPRMRVCSQHFTKDDYILPDAPADRRILKKTSVPSQNLLEKSRVNMKTVKVKLNCQELYTIHLNISDPHTMLSGEIMAEEEEILDTKNIKNENINEVNIKSEEDSEQSVEFDLNVMEKIKNERNEEEGQDNFECLDRIKYECEIEDMKVEEIEQLNNEKTSEFVKHKENNSACLTQLLYTCTMCDFKSESKGHFTKHMTTHTFVDDESLWFTCEECGIKTKKKYELNHKLIHKNGNEIVPKISYQCNLCNFLTHYKYLLRNHMIVHQPKKYTCDKCNFKGKSRKSLIQHKLSHIPKIMHKCGICDCQTTNKKFLKTHMLIHKKLEEFKMYSCKSCKFQTKYKYKLKSHRIHKNSEQSTICDS